MAGENLTMHMAKFVLKLDPMYKKRCLDFDKRQTSTCTSSIDIIVFYVLWLALKLLSLWTSTAMYEVDLMVHFFFVLMDSFFSTLWIPL